MLVFITPRDPRKEDWKGTQVGTRGVISVRQEVSTTAIGQFILERGKLIDGAPPMMTQRQKEKMRDEAFTNPEAILNSDSYRVHLADRSMRVVSCLSWKWRKRSSVKIAERTYEKRAQALHC